jgi:hypothetical protein
VDPLDHAASGGNGPQAFGWIKAAALGKLNLLTVEWAFACAATAFTNFVRAPRLIGAVG